MNVKIIHCDINDWRVYPANETNDFYLCSYREFFEAKMYANQNFHILITRECLIKDCFECKNANLSK